MGFVFIWGKATDTTVGSGGFISAELADICLIKAVAINMYQRAP